MKEWMLGPKSGEAKTGVAGGVNHTFFDEWRQVPRGRREAHHPGIRYLLLAGLNNGRYGQTVAESVLIRS